jgi:hypothetical protein
LETGREIDRQIAKLQQMQRESAERFKELGESMGVPLPPKKDKIKTMDLERAMEFMLEQQAKFDERQVKFDERQVKFDERQVKFDERDAKLQEQHAKFQENLAAHDKRLAKAERLLIRGAESLAIHRDAIKTHREAMQETDRRITALVLSQEDLRASLRAFIDSMRKGGNGQ